MGRVRALEERDIPRVVDLHRRVLLPDAAATGQLDAHHAYFKELFLDAAWYDGQPSLVYEDEGGQPIGFLGVMARRMTLRDRPIRAVITAHFIVEPDRRATLAGIELIRALLVGPQDLTLADEAGDISRKLFEGLGGTAEILYSLYWVRLLRPGKFVVSSWGKGWRKTGPVLTLLCQFVDAVVTHWPGGPFGAPALATSGEELDGDTLAACIAEFTRSRALRPEYDGRTATWLLKILARKPGCGPLRKALVRTAAGEIAGWYLYSGHRGGTGEVLAVGAREERIGEVLDHLFAQAWRDGMVALIGRIDPRFVGPFSARGCFFHHRGHWTLIHSRDPELIQAFQRGDAFLTRLEGEWCMRF
jgi:hypothetical protein